MSLVGSALITVRSAMKPGAMRPSLAESPKRSGEARRSRCRELSGEGGKAPAPRAAVRPPESALRRKLVVRAHACRHSVGAQVERRPHGSWADRSIE